MTGIRRKFESGRANRWRTAGRWCPLLVATYNLNDFIGGHFVSQTTWRADIGIPISETALKCLRKWRRAGGALF
jgi:hypothetical protein